MGTKRYQMGRGLINMESEWEHSIRTAESGFGLVRQNQFCTKSTITVGITSTFDFCASQMFFTVNFDVMKEMISSSYSCFCFPCVAIGGLTLQLRRGWNSILPKSFCYLRSWHFYLTYRQFHDGSNLFSCFIQWETV